MGKEFFKAKYIKNSVEGMDLFPGKSQEKIATSIAELIVEGNKDIKIIGLEGPWGAGKSNLIEIMQNQLKESHYVFTYDAWGHQEDLQRRSFLESLTEKLSNEKIIDKSSWSKKLKNLLAKKRETDEKTIPRMSTAFIFLFLVTIFTPIFKQISDSIIKPDKIIEINSLFNFYDPSDVIENHSSTSRAFLKILITAIPLLFFLILYLISNYRKNKTFKVDSSELFYLYKGKELKKTTYLTISEKEPSGREFKNWMLDLSCDLNKDLIVVFDNMDRLPPEKVKQLWSSIHTFFSEHSFKKIWTIVTFDRNHLKEAFGDDDVSDQFINKTFSTIFRVAPPVLTDWHEFFDMKFKEAFLDSEEEEREIVRRVFDAHYDDITPRNIIAFINELVTHKRTVHDNIKLRYIALFVSEKKDILDDPINRIIEKDFLKSDEPLFVSDNSLQDNIAALVYNVGIESASQVTLSRGIELAIDKIDSDRFNELTKHIHFLEILEAKLHKDIHNIENLVLLLNELNEKYINEDKVKKRLPGIWRHLANRSKHKHIKEISFTIVQQALIVNLPKEPLESYLKYLIREICILDKFDSTKYFNTIGHIENFLNDNNVDFDVYSELRSKIITPEQFIDFLKAAGSEYSRFKLSCNESDLNGYIIEQIPDALKDYRCLSYIRDEYDFNSLIKAIEKHLDNISADNFAALYSLYKTVSKERPIKTLLPDKTIHDFLQGSEENSEGYYDLIAMRLAKTNGFPTNWGGRSRAIINQAEDLLVEKISERIEFFMIYSDILLKSVNWNSPLLRSVAKKITLKSYPDSRLNIVEALKGFKPIYEAISVDPIKLLERLNDWNVKKHLNVKNITNVIADAEFFEYAVQTDYDLSNYTIETFCEYLNKPTVEEWSTALKDENSYLYKSVYWLLKEGKLKNVPENGVIAYKSYLKNIADSSIGIPSEKNLVFYERVNKNKLKATYKDIRDYFTREENISPELFTFFFEALLAHGDLKQNAGDVARKILAPVLDNAESFDLILKYKPDIVEIVNKAGDDADDFKDSIKLKCEQNPDLLDFAKEMKIQCDYEDE